ncbi:L,D-transpeptidase family protein [Novosphingobium sp. Gsoil 351]|uniref:L,D-transpeptidase family protein n=1 Tax=Novosphingobium sp. Gsoil 351 TaxID=2675225 RepID=UPI0012B44356|nr:L,D-transpeptidase family protein [Novosphingobium sp. Gsoil 351]QGN53420.1 L,D-transpeptidase family protein [Novosphingobium sp. Gsoil 351]
MRKILFASPFALAVAACGLNGTDHADKQSDAKSATSQATSQAAAEDPLLSHDPTGNAPLDPVLADDKPRPEMQAQVVLDRLGFTPGVVDGAIGMSTHNALRGFQLANDLEDTGELDDATRRALGQWSNIPATRVVTIPSEFAAGPFFVIPKDPQDEAKMSVLGYESLDEKLAERFHTTVAVLKELNANAAPMPSTSPTPTPTPSETASGATFTPQPGPPSYFHAGQQIRVPNVGADRIDPGLVTDSAWLATLQMLGVGTVQPKADKIVVDKSAGTLFAYDSAGKLVAAFTATMGSTHDPLPLGDWKILGVSKNPPFHYNPALFWDAKAGDEKAKLPPGPNGPVGVAWIDLSKEHYGIHGTPHPETIGRAESHGCVRLTNWDVARLSQMVSGSTKVSFVA